MPEGLSASEVGKEIGEHAKHGGSDHGRAVPIAEAAVLAMVAIIAAWSGFSAAKWGTESSLHLAKASSTRSKANRNFQEALTYRVGDALTFNAWLAAHTAGDANVERVAAKRFRPGFKKVFDEWLATDPFTNTNAPPGPQSMPDYHPPGLATSAAQDAQADAYYDDGEHAAKNADNYIRATVILASVLFIVGISSHFPLKGIRIGLISVGVALLLFAVIDIATLPWPP